MTHLTKTAARVQHPPTELAADELERRLQYLDPAERRVLALHYGLDGNQPHHLAEVCHLVHLSRARTREVDARAMSKLRHPSAGGPWA